MGILQLLDDLPEAASRAPDRLWSVFARSLGEQGAAGRTALAWRWALTGGCPSPVTLTNPADRVPGRRELLAEAEASAELASAGADPGGQVLHGRLVLRWLAGDIDALPLWNADPDDVHACDGAAYAHSRERIDEVYFWGLLAKQRYPWREKATPAAQRLAFGWACGVMDLMSWVCGEAAEGPLSGARSSGRPTLYEASLDACRGMTGVAMARDAGDLTLARRREAVMETFLWLAGWNPAPPVDDHGRARNDHDFRPTPA
jgi:hypothetical protein